MDAPRIERLLHGLGCDKIKQGNTGWVYATCPLARWRHPSGADAKPSFAVSIEPDSASHYKCHACNATGELTALIWAILRNRKRTNSGPSEAKLAELLREVQAHNAPSPSDLKARMARINEDGYQRHAGKTVAGVVVSPRTAAQVPVELELPTLPESTLDGLRNVPSDVLAYLTGPDRRLTPQSVETWELGWHARAQRVAIPIRDCSGALVGISGRAFLRDQLPKYLHSSGFRRDYYLYGEHRLRTGERGYLCEGFFDVIYLRQFGFNAVAMLGSHLSRFQVEKIVRFFSEIVIVPDGDGPGYEAARKAEAQLSSRLHTVVAKVPFGKDPDQLNDDELTTLLGPIGAAVV